MITREKLKTIATMLPREFSWLADNQHAVNVYFYNKKFVLHIDDPSGAITILQLRSICDYTANILQRLGAISQRNPVSASYVIHAVVVSWAAAETASMLLVE